MEIGSLIGRSDPFRLHSVRRGDVPSLEIRGLSCGRRSSGVGVAKRGHVDMAAADVANYGTGHSENL
jgi:hypothetical protein